MNTLQNESWQLGDGPVTIRLEGWTTASKLSFARDLVFSCGTVLVLR